MTLGSGPDDVVALVQVAEADVAEVNGPHAVRDLLEADGMLFERLGEVDEPALAAEENLARLGDAPFRDPISLGSRS